MAEDQGVKVQTSQFQFMFPFMLKDYVNADLVSTLLGDGFEFFKLENEDQEQKFYGGNKVSHRSLEKFFLPNIEKILFPETVKDLAGLRRFTKTINLECDMESEHIRTSFKIPSFDIIICPFQIGIMNIRVDLPEELSLSDSLHFSSEFRVMEPIEDDDSIRIIQCENESYYKVKDFIFHALCTKIQDYIDEQNEASPYFGSLPFFMDERMYMIGYFDLNEDSEITATDLFRVGHLYGYNPDGTPFIGANNSKYIDRYYEKNVYDRWADETYFVVSDYTFSCVTKSSDEKLNKVLANGMYGKHFYSILLYFFYKIVLMKLSYEQSEIEINKDKDDIEELILKITDFSSRYYFPEVNSSTVGKEIFTIVKDVFQIDYLYSYVKTTLETLYQNHEKLTSKRHNYLLQILTIYTVISGIYGMNLVIQDWEGEIKWSKIPGYSFFEWISLIVAISGITVGTILGFFALKNWMKENLKKHKKRK